MRFLQIASFYSHYLAGFYRARPGLADRPYAEQLAALLDDGFSSVHLLAPDMAPLGYDPTIIIGNALSLQRAWAREHGLPLPTVEADLPAIVRAQIDHHQPDVLYLLDGATYDGRFLRTVTWRPAVVLGWRAATIPAGTDWHGLDILLSSDAGCRARALDLGARRAESFLPGIPDDHLDRLGPPPAAPAVDLVFSGNLTGEHGSRTRMLTAVAGLAAERGWTARFHVTVHDVAIPDRLRPFIAPPLFGNAMYRALRDARLCLNNHIDVLGGRGQNMRVFEATGSGACLLTEADPDLPALFTPGHEVATFMSDTDLLDRISHYQTHRDERDALAQAGRARCVRDHRRSQRAAWLHRILQSA